MPNSIIVLVFASATAALAAEWFFIAALSAAMKKRNYPQRSLRAQATYGSG
jgi:hypothetical protein